MIGIFRRDKTPQVSRYNYKINAFDGIDAKTDNTKLPLSFGSYSYNIAIENCILKTGIGINPAVLTDSNGNQRILPDMSSMLKTIKGLYVYRAYDYEYNLKNDRIIIRASDNKFYQVGLYEGSNYVEIEGLSSTSDDVTCINYYMDGKDAFLVYTGDGGMFHYVPGTLTKFENAPGLKSACMHYDRVFGVDSKDYNKIHFSAPLVPTDFSVESGGGSISLMDEGGKINKVVSFKDYVFVFRDYAIHRLTAYTEPSEYSISKVFTSSEKIIADTVAVADRYIVFLCGNSLYKFDGYNLSKVYDGMSALIENSDFAVGVTFKGKYYLSVRMKKEGNEKVGDEIEFSTPKNNAIFCFDTLFSDNVAIMRGVDVRGFMPLVIGDYVELLVYFNNARSAYIGMLDWSGKLYGNKLDKLFVSPTSNVGDLTRLKALRRIFVMSKYDFNLTIKQGDMVSEKLVSGNNSPTETAFSTVGDEISYRIKTNDDLMISELQFSFDLVRRYYAK